MFKRMIVLIISLLLAAPGTSFASGQSGHFYPPSNSDYFSKKFSWQFYTSKNVKQIRFTQYNMKDIKMGLTTFTNLSGTPLVWMDFYCPGKLSIEFLDKNGVVLKTFARGQATSYLNGSTCTKDNFVKLSDYNEQTGKYKSDTFGQNKKNSKKSRS